MKRNLLMVAGPTEIEDDVLAYGARPLVYNRTPEFSEHILKIEKGLQELFVTKNRVFILTSSGTGAMETAVVNLLSSGDKVLVVDAGTFGHRWFEIADAYGVECDVIKVPQGISVDPELIRSRITEDIKAVFVTANETSVGITIDLKKIGLLVKDTNAVLVVDAVSSLGSDPLETDNWFCDVVITSTQKALALPPGLSFITVSDKAWSLVEKSTLPKYYFNLKEYRANMLRGQTPFTPAISLLFQLGKRLEKLHEIGLTETISIQRKKSLYLRKGCERLGLSVIGDSPSNGVVGIKVPEHLDAFEVVQILRKEHGVEIAPSPGEDKHKVIRIGMFGAIDLSDIDKLLNVLEGVLSEAM
ncbi:MAG: alanine--glyoxylate aminotransferase family protein [Gammaproteobacteria bacterium]|nr:alanine--glyoxylate aminotransferase family protein [Gammaproteobacteria bacterium]